MRVHSIVQVCVNGSVFCRQIKPGHKNFRTTKISHIIIFIVHLRVLLAHMGRVTGICFSLEDEWVLSVGRDKYFQWHETKKGNRMGGYQTQAWCTSIKYPFNHYIQYCEYI
jgi:hypothetical protein